MVVDKSECVSPGMWVVWCPECGYEAEVPPGGVDYFPLNYILQKQLVLEALNSSTTIIYCDLCQDGEINWLIDRLSE